MSVSPKNLKFLVGGFSFLGLNGLGFGLVLKSSSGCAVSIFLIFFLRESLSMDLNQPNFCGIFSCCVDDELLLFWDGVRLGSGLALGVDRRRRVEMSRDYNTKEMFFFLIKKIELQLIS